mgnify:CR=1 FL=1
MGSRGARSGLGRRGVRVTLKDGTVFSYESYKGIVIDTETSKIIPLTLKQISERAKKYGGNVELFNEKDLKEQEKKRKAEREETDKQLDALWYKGPRPRKGWKGH